MKKSLVFSALLGLALMIGVSGCKHKPVGTTVIPGTKPDGTEVAAKPELPTAPEVQPPVVPPVVPPAPPIVEPQAPATGEPIPFPEKGKYVDIANRPHTEDYEILAKDTVYFDTDAATIKSSEQAKLKDAAEYIKSNNEAVQIQGHCDERGTEGYNLSLGERRAQAVREYLINLGVNVENLGTASFGEAKPADAGHNEAAWKKNRRCLLVVLKAK